MTVVHLSVVGGLQIQTRLSSFAEREEQVARRTSQERVNPFRHCNNSIISIPSSSNTTNALQCMPMMCSNASTCTILISCFGMAGQKACCAALHVQKHLSRPDLEDHLCPCLCLSHCTWIMKANMLHEVVDPQHETASLNKFPDLTSMKTLVIHR